MNMCPRPPAHSLAATLILRFLLIITCSIALPSLIGCEDGNQGASEQSNTAVDPRRYDFANVYWDPKYPLRCLVTGQIILPDSDGVYSIWFSSNEAPHPSFKVISKKDLPNFWYYKFYSKEICEEWCRERLEQIRTQ